MFKTRSKGIGSNKIKYREYSNMEIWRQDHRYATRHLTLKRGSGNLRLHQRKQQRLINSKNHNSRIHQQRQQMAVPTSTLDNFKVETTFGDGYVVHTTYEWEFSTRGQMESSRWDEVRCIGTGAFGSVWLEKEESGGQLRAVKRLPRASLAVRGFSRELPTLITLGDVSTS